VFPYIAQPVIEIAAQGGLTVEINPGESEVSESVGVRLRVGAVAALEAILDALG
jgi:NAD-dependent deacetylase